MKKDILKTVLFSLIIAGVFTFSFFEVKDIKKEDEVKEISSKVIQFEGSEVETVIFGEYELFKEGFTWTLKKPYFDYLDYARVEQWLNSVLAQDGRSLSDLNEKVEWERFGIEKRSKKISFISKNGNSVQVEVSNRDAFDGSVYIRTSRKKESDKNLGLMLYTSGAEWKKFFAKDIESLRTNKIFDWEVPSPQSKVKEVTFSYKGKVRTMKKESDVWVSVEKKKWSLDQNKLNSILEGVRTLESNSLDFDFKESQASKLGSIEVTDGENKKFKVDVLKFNNEYFAKSNYRKGLFFKISKNNVKEMFPNLWDFRSFDDAVALEKDKVVQIFFKKGDKKTTFRKVNGEWTTYKDNIPAGRELNGASLLKLLDDFEKLKYVRYMPLGGYLGTTDKIIKFIQNDKKAVRFYVGRKTNCKEEHPKREDCFLIRSNNLYIGAKRSVVNTFFRRNFFKIKSRTK